jgi:hypothetical protein
LQTDLKSGDILPRFPTTGEIKVEKAIGETKHEGRFLGQNLKQKIANI